MGMLLHLFNLLLDFCVVFSFFPPHLFFFNFYWRVVDLQCCASFRCMQIDPLFIYIYLLFSRFFPHIGHYRVLSRVPYAGQLVQFRSVAQSCPTLCDPMNRSTPGLPVHHQLPEFTQTHVHRVSDAIQPSHPLSSPSLLTPSPSQHQGLFQ